MNNKGDKGMDKEKLKKAGLLTIAFFVLLTVIIFVVSKINHKPFEFQFLRFFNLSGKASRRIARFYHDYRLRGEKRCDLHPSVDENGEYISVDTTCIGKRRSVMVFRRNR